jgi:PAS domain S-box-containing protein
MTSSAPQRTTHPDKPAATDHLLAQVFDALPDGILLLDRDWRITFANRRARQISRLTDEDLHNKTHWQLYPETVGTTVHDTYQRVMNTGVEGHIKAFFYEPFQVWLDVRVLPTEAGIALYYRDVTETRRAENERRAANDQLQQVLAATTDGIVIVDHDWRIAFMNERAHAVLAPSGDVLGTNLWESFPNAAYEGSPYVEHYHRAMNDRIASSFEAFYPEPLNMWLQLMVHPSPAGMICFFRDITQQKQRESALIQSEKLAAVGRMASSIAHEINNPLESVTNLLYIARSYAIVPEVQNLLDLADQELRRVAIIANQTLRFHKQASSPREISCTDLFATVLSLFEGRLKNSAILVTKRKRATRTIACFEGDIRQVLNNLVGNAIDAMTFGSKSPGGRLLLRSREATDWRTGRRGLVLTVADTGPGMSPETCAHAFDAFFTTKGINGTGLGLWISSEIVTRHEGRLLLRSSQHPAHHGSVFSLFLPFQALLGKNASRPN